MELFSKRNNKGKNLRSYRNYHFRYRNESDEDSIRLVENDTRTRLHELLKFACSTDSFFERYMMVHDENKNEFHLYSKMFTDFSTREAGYDISDYIRLDNLEFKSEKPDDSRLFDFIEMLLIFAESTEREELVRRLNKIFKEESDPYTVHGFMIVETDYSGLRSALPLIKDSQLQKSLREYYKNNTADAQYEVMAKISASILQRITTSPTSKDQTKNYAEQLCEEVASRWTKKEYVDSLKTLMSETILNAKRMSNEISDIRHSDQSTIPVDSPKIYKLIASKNINLVELIVLTLPEKFISEQNPEELKDSYVNEYRINVNTAPRIKKRPVEEINPEDIPF